MKYFYVIGNKTSKSLSPLIFNHWFKKYNIEAKYKFIEVSESKFDKVLIDTIKNKKTHGLNITIPYKKKIIKHLDKKTSHAKKIGAVNCVSVGKKIKGTNTDWVGYLQSIKPLKINKNNKILIFGFGGASQAIYYGLYFKGYKNVEVFNRTRKAIRINTPFKYTKKYSMVDNYLCEADLIINTTPTTPLSKKQLRLINNSTIISDIVYKPKNTNFLINFRKNKKIYGQTMLIQQAIPCFKLWFGFEPKVDKELLRKINIKTK